MRLKPSPGMVVIRACEAESQSPAGIIIPDQAKKKPQSGIVVSVGAGKMLDSGKQIKPFCESGDKVIFSQFAGTEVTVADEKLIVIADSEILAKSIG